MEYNLLFDNLVMDIRDRIHVKALSINGKVISVPVWHYEVIKGLEQYKYLDIKGSTKDEVWFTLRRNVSMKPTLVGSNEHKVFIGKNPPIGYLMVADEDTFKPDTAPLLDVVYTSKDCMIRDLKEREALSRYHGFTSHRFEYSDRAKGLLARIKLLYPDGETKTIHLHSFSIQ